jgi:hypothetical protein
VFGNDDWLTIQWPGLVKFSPTIGPARALPKFRLLQQDGAPCHMSYAAFEWLEQRYHVLRAWPLNSPDLSPIEMCWAILKRGVTLRNPQTLDDHRDVLHDVWSGILQASIDRLCRSFQGRLRMCLDRGS